MKIHRIFLYQFRNYAKITIPFSKRLTLICGKNTYGKTNILESIGLLSYGKSFRDCPTDSLIMHGKENCGIQGEIEQEEILLNKKNSPTLKENIVKDKITLNIERKNGKSSKQIYINKKKMKSLSEFIGRLVTVYFMPNDIELVSGSVSIRRRFFDGIMCLSDQSYMQSLLAYNKVISQRNALLKRPGGIFKIERELDQWDHSLNSLVPIIRKCRKLFLPTFQTFLTEALKKISGEQDNVEIENEDLEETPEQYREKINASRSNDYRYHFTTVGPHRDVYRLKSEDRPYAIYASQGQKRSVAIALRYAQFRYFSKYLGEHPVLLIDDVMRELDRDRRRFFLELLTNCGQALITLPDLEDVSSLLTGIQKEIEIIQLTDPATISFQESLV